MVDTRAEFLKNNHHSLRVMPVSCGINEIAWNIVSPLLERDNVSRFRGSVIRKGWEVRVHSEPA